MDKVENDVSISIGPESVSVTGSWERIASSFPELIEAARVIASKASSTSNPECRTLIRVSDTNLAESGVSQNDDGEMFGEFFSQFPEEISDSESVMVAALYADKETGQSGFRTRDVSRLLTEQRIKLSNPSTNLKRHLKAKRLFAVGNGEFRVSKSGLKFVEELAQKGEQ